MGGAFNAKGNIFFIPRSSGLAYDDISDEALRALTTEPTEEELASPFGKYYETNISVPTEEMLRAKKADAL